MLLFYLHLLIAAILLLVLPFIWKRRMKCCIINSFVELADCHVEPILCHRYRKSYGRVFAGIRYFFWSWRDCFLFACLCWCAYTLVFFLLLLLFCFFVFCFVQRKLCLPLARIPRAKAAATTRPQTVLRSIFWRMPMPLH